MHRVSLSSLPGILAGALLGLLVASPPVLASGGYGGGGGSYRGSASRSDPTYDRGKALYQGRAREHRGLEVCLAQPVGETSQPIGISRRSLGDYKRSSARALAEDLVHCEAPHGAIASELEAGDLRALLHYLNKRYALRLTG